MAVRKNKLVQQMKLNEFVDFIQEFYSSILRIKGSLNAEEYIEVMNISTKNQEFNYFKNNIRIGIMLHESVIKGNYVDLYVNELPYISAKVGLIRNLTDSIMLGTTLGILGEGVHFVTNNKELGKYSVAKELKKAIKKELPKYREEVKRKEKEIAGLK